MRTPNSNKNIQTRKFQIKHKMKLLVPFCQKAWAPAMHRDADGVQAKDEISVYLLPLSSTWRLMRVLLGAGPANLRIIMASAQTP